MRNPLNLLLSLAILVVGFLPSIASGFNRTVTCMDPEDRDPQAPTSTPICQGNDRPQPFYWKSSTITYRINDRGLQSEFPTSDERIEPGLRQAIVESVEVWNEPECSVFEFVEGELTSTEGFDPRDDVNVIVFQEEAWPYSSRAIALSSVSVRPDGEIVDADLELNAETFVFSDEPDGLAGTYDIRNTITHEAGHLLGLDHTPVREATMWFNSQLGEIKKRELHPDDIEGVCAVYPPQQPEKPKRPPTSTGCCSLVDAGPTPAWLVGAIALALAARQLRSRTFDR